jgi:hypothetical protein
MAKRIKLDMEDINEIQVADTDSESGADDSDLKNEFEDSEDEEQLSAQQDEAQTATCSRQRITNLGTASRKEYQYPTFCWSSRRFEKQ